MVEEAASLVAEVWGIQMKMRKALINSVIVEPTILPRSVHRDSFMEVSIPAQLASLVHALLKVQLPTFEVLVCSKLRMRSRE